MPEHEDEREQLSVAPGPPRRPLIIAAIAVAVIIAVGIAGAVVQRQGAQSSSPITPASSPSSAPPPPASTIRSPSPSASGTHVHRARGETVAGIDPGWVIYGYGSTQFVAYRPATGEVQTLDVPSVNGPSELVVSDGIGIIRSGSEQTGMRVDLRTGAHKLAGALNRPARFLPGPRPGVVWSVTDGERTATAALVEVATGRRVGQLIELPAGAGSYSVLPDQTGQLIALGIGGAYRMDDIGAHRITTGQIMAIGPTNLMTIECDARGRCDYLVVDRRTGDRHKLAGNVEIGGLTPYYGVIAPDGSRAMCIGAGGSLILVDLTTGQHRPVTDDAQATQDPRPAVWAPDSRHAFFVGYDGQLHLVDAATGAVRKLDLPDLTLDSLAAESDS